MRGCARSSARRTTCSSSPPPAPGRIESAFVNLLSPGEKALVVSHGEFGSRWQKLGAALGVDVVPLTYDWGQTPAAGDVARELAESGAKVAFIVHSGDVDRRRLGRPSRSSLPVTRPE